MPPLPQQYNEVTPLGNIVSASPFHVVTYQEVFINVSPDAKEIYKQEGGKYIDDIWVDVYALTELGLSQLANAAGIHGVPERIDDRSSPYVCAYRFNGEWMQPDSTVLSFATDYELDLRAYINVNGVEVKGARFEQALQAGLDLLIVQHFKNDPRVKGLQGDAKKNKLALLRKDLDSETLKAFEERAEEKALKSIIQMRVHMISRAQTGAKERFIRKVLGLKNAYTIAELKNPFRIPRSEFRFDKMLAQLGPELARPLLELKAASLLNIAPEALAQYKQLAAPQSIHPAHTTPPVGEQSAETVAMGDAMGDIVTATADVIVGVVSDTSTATIPDSVSPPSAPGVSSPIPSHLAILIQQSDADMISVDLGGGKQKAMPRHEIIGVKVANSDWFKNRFLNHKHFLDKNGQPVRKHFNNSLLDHFGINSPVNLTWEMLVAMQQHLDGKGDDPKYYPPVPQNKKSKKIVQPNEELTLSERIMANAGLSTLVTQWQKDYHLPAEIESDGDLADMLSVVLEGIEKGHFKTDSAEGLAEIDKEFRVSFKSGVTL